METFELKKKFLTRDDLYRHVNKDYEKKVIKNKKKIN